MQRFSLEVKGASCDRDLLEQTIERTVPVDELCSDPIAKPRRQDVCSPQGIIRQIFRSVIAHRVTVHSSPVIPRLTIDRARDLNQSTSPIECWSTAAGSLGEYFQLSQAAWI